MYSNSCHTFSQPISKEFPSLILVCMYMLTHTARTGPHICRFLVNTAPSNCWDGARVRGDDIEEYTNDDIEGQGKRDYGGILLVSQAAL